jgi:hypothetical protein
MKKFIIGSYLGLKLFLDSFKTEKQKLIIEIQGGYLFQYSDFINKVVNDLLEKGFNECNIIQTLYITDYKMPLIGIEIYTDTDERLYYTVWYKKLRCLAVFLFCKIPLQ